MKSRSGILDEMCEVFDFLSRLEAMFEELLG
jgi:hypothetical protein